MNPTEKELTKEECLEALANLCDSCHVAIIDNTQECVWHGKCPNVKRLEKLINEHFELKRELKIRLDSAIRIFKTLEEPPKALKFDELHEDMWVWDNKKKKYSQIYHIVTEDKYILTSIYACDTVEFEENRFYRYEVR